jgi:hypothetical protein
MIYPTSKFVLLQWVPKGESIAILLPDGARPSNGGDFIVQAVGPEVPQIPPISKGSKVLLRGDAPPISGVEEKNKIGMIHYEWIMAVVSDETEPLDLPTDEEIRKIAAN